MRNVCDVRYTRTKRESDQSLTKKAAIGPDVNLDEFQRDPVPHHYLSDQELRSLPDSERQRLMHVWGGCE